MFLAGQMFVDFQPVEVDSEAKQAKISLLYWCTRWQKSIFWAAVDVQCDKRALLFGPIDEPTKREIVEGCMTAWETNLVDEQVFAKSIAEMFEVRATVDSIA